jgi:hypothetical protein
MLSRRREKLWLRHKLLPLRANNASAARSA